MSLVDYNTYRTGFDGAFVAKMEGGDVPPNRRRKIKSDKFDRKEVGNRPFLCGYRIHVLEAGIGKARSGIFREKIAAFGGSVCPSISDRPNVLIVDETVTADRVCRLLKVDSPPSLDGMEVVRSLWLSDCIKGKKLVPIEHYKLQSVRSSVDATLMASRKRQVVVQTVQQCSDDSLPPSNEDLQAGSNCVITGDENLANDDALAVSSEAAITHPKSLPVSSSNYVDAF